VKNLLALEFQLPANGFRLAVKRHFEQVPILGVVQHVRVGGYFLQANSIRHVHKKRVGGPGYRLGRSLQCVLRSFPAHRIQTDGRRDAVMVECPHGGVLDKIGRKVPVHNVTNKS